MGLYMAYVVLYRFLYWFYNGVSRISKEALDHALNHGICLKPYPGALYTLDRHFKNPNLSPTPLTRNLTS